MQVDPTKPTGSRGNPAKGKGRKGGCRLMRQSRPARVGTLRRASEERRMQVDPTEPTGSRGNPAKGEKGEGGCRLIRQSPLAHVGTLRRAREVKHACLFFPPLLSLSSEIMGKARGAAACELSRLCRRRWPYSCSSRPSPHPAPSAPLRSGKDNVLRGSLLSYRVREEWLGWRRTDLVS